MENKYTHIIFDAGEIPGKQMFSREVRSGQKIKQISEKKGGGGMSADKMTSNQKRKGLSYLQKKKSVFGQRW